VRYPHQEWVWPDWFIINDQDLNELTTILRQNEQPVWKANTEIIDCFIQISRIVDKSDREHYDTKLKIFVNALFSFFLDLLRKGDIQLNEGLTETKRTVELFLMELNDHLIDDWSLNSMAEHCNLGVTQFSKYCREITNCSPLTYLNGLRLRKASVLLREDTVLPVTEIAYQAGFSSPQYFTSAFKKHFQLTPQVFREQCEKDFG
jgi:AraC family L-rhamnose operon regulatory protein RhaS